jgi:hypothetical protein
MIFEADEMIYRCVVFVGADEFGNFAQSAENRGPM